MIRGLEYKKNTSLKTWFTPSLQLLIQWNLWWRTTLMWGHPSLDSQTTVFFLDLSLRMSKEVKRLPRTTPLLTFRLPFSETFSLIGWCGWNANQRLPLFSLSYHFFFSETFPLMRPWGWNAYQGPLLFHFQTTFFFLKPSPLTCPSRWNTDSFTSQATLFSETFPLVYPCWWNANHGPPLLSDHSFLKPFPLISQRGWNTNQGPPLS